MHKSVAIAGNRRQRRVVFLVDLDAAGKARCRQTMHVIEHIVNVDRLALEIGAAERGHAINELGNAVRLLADQLRQLPVGVARLRFEELRRAANAGERILDFVGENSRPSRRRSARHRGATIDGPYARPSSATRR